MIKLQLDKDALERLIGRDSQVEIDLRSGIVQNFAKKYLKAVAQSELMCKAQDYVREHLRKELKIAGTWGVWDPPQPVKDAIKLQVEGKMNALIAAMIEAKTQELTALIQVRLDGMAYRVETKLVEAEVERRVQAEVARRLTLAARDGGGGGGGGA